MKLTKEEVERFKVYAFQKMPSALCKDWLAMREMLEEVGKMFDHLQNDGPHNVTELEYLNGKLKELLG